MRLPHSRLFNIIISIRRVAVFFVITFSSYVDAYIIVFVVSSTRSIKNFLTLSHKNRRRRKER
jgi:hypothetical protein